MLGVFCGRELRLYRLIRGKAVHWRTIRGRQENLLRALAAAQSVLAAAVAAGGWSEALGFDLDPPKPVPARPARRLRLYDPNRRLRE